VRALEKAGWTIQPDQFLLRIDRRHRVYIDIEAHHSYEEAIMVVEVKCFQSPNSETTDLYAAIGQYLVYQSLLEDQAINALLCLAVPIVAYKDIFQRMGMSAVTKNQVKMMIVDMEQEIIVQWLP
jgi:XisH protein